MLFVYLWSKWMKAYYEMFQCWGQYCVCFVLFLLYTFMIFMYLCSCLFEKCDTEKKKQKKWKQCLDQRLVFSLSNELYKFFDCLSHELQNLNSCKIKCIYIGNFGHAFNLLTISPLENSILQLAATMAYGRNFFLEFHKDQF